MKHPFKGAVRKVAAMSAIALAASVVPVSMSSAAKVQAPKQGGDITVGIFNQMPLEGFCFGNAANSALGVLKTVYEGLLEQRSDGRIVPHLAQSITPSADYKTWTIKLRSGVKYHDGTTMTVANAIRNMQAIRGFLFAGAAATLGLAGATTAVGHTLGSGVPLVANWKDVRAVSADTFAIDLWNAQIDFPEWAYASGRFFMRADSDLAAGGASQCVTSGKGSGPFKVSSYSRTEIKVVKNADYWRKDKAGNQLPYLNSITFKYVNQPTQRVNGLKSGTLDAAGFTSAGEIKQIINVQADSKLKTIISPDDYYAMNIFNTAIEPFNNKNARLAVAYAFDTNTFYKQRNCFKGKCVGTVPTSMVGKRNIMYNTAGFITHNVAKAKEYAAKYKSETGKDLSFQLPADTSAEAQASAKAFAQIMKKSGITVSILTQDTATITSTAFPSPTSGKVNTYQMYPTTLFEGTGTGFILPFIQSNGYSAPGNLTLRATGALAPLFGGFGRLINPSRFSDAAQDALVWAAQFDTTSARRTKLKAVTKYMQENANLLPVPTTQYLYGFNANLKGFDTFLLAAGGRGRPMTNAGVNWTGVYLDK
jgi:peptide/nickel transport system substrate-binding protein